MLITIEEKPRRNRGLCLQSEAGLLPAPYYLYKKDAFFNIAPDLFVLSPIFS